jgi:hypothetical protein
MKKLIGVIIILITLLLSVIYRRLTGSHVKEKPRQVFVAAALRQELVLSYLLIQ